MDKVTVMLSTYNGERFLHRQINSILDQKNVEVNLLIRDDGSKDSTINILQKYENKFANIEVIYGENIGYIKSFMKLVELVKVEENMFYAFSDQDDYWKPEKLYEGIKLMKEQKEIKIEPVAYYSDLNVVDENEVFIKKANSWEGSIDKYKLAMFIGIRGCTMIYNDRLQYLLHQFRYCPISGHDTFVMLLAFWSGKVVYDSRAFINYRQTGNNLSLTGKNKLDNLKKNFTYVKKRLTTRANIHQLNAYAVVSQFRDNIRDANELKLIADYKKSFKTKIKLLRDKNFWNFKFSIKCFNLLFIIINKL